jgi:predicted nucleic acid-binding Zn ribbon protein
MSKRETVQALPKGLAQCPYCGLFFAPSRSDQRFCSDSCRVMEARKNKAEADNVRIVPGGMGTWG